MGTHIETMLSYEIGKALERLQRRGIGVIGRKDGTSVEYVVDGISYEVAVKVKSTVSKSKKKG